jgi:hypothetical protein
MEGWVSPRAKLDVVTQRNPAVHFMGSNYDGRKRILKSNLPAFPVGNYVAGWKKSV